MLAVLAAVGLLLVLSARWPVLVPIQRRLGRVRTPIIVGGDHLVANPMAPRSPDWDRRRDGLLVPAVIASVAWTPDHQPGQPRPELGA
jgi:hypothetical protein